MPSRTVHVHWATACFQETYKAFNTIELFVIASKSMASETACSAGRKYVSDAQHYATTISKYGIIYIQNGPKTGRTTLFCIHGWSCRASDYVPLLTHFQDTPSIALSLPGHDEASTKVYPEASISAFAKAAVDLMQELGLEDKDVVLTGHSMGCRVTLETWHQARERGIGNIRGIVLLDGSHYKLRARILPFDRASNQYPETTAEQRQDMILDAFRKMFSANTPVEFQGRALAHVHHLTSTDAEFNLDMRASLIAWDYEYMDERLAELGQSGLPVLVVQATDADAEGRRLPLSRGMMSPWMRHVQDRVPKARHEVVEGSGHFPQIDQTDVVAGAMRAWLDEQGECTR